MKILYIINSLATGGAEKLILDTIPQLNKQDGMFVDLALLNAENHPFYKELKNKYKDIKVFELSHGNIYNPFLIFKIMMLLRKYDIVHIHLFPASYFTVIAKFLLFSRIKLIFTEHSTNNRRLQSPKFKYIQNFIYSFFDKVVCITNEVEAVLLKYIDTVRGKTVIIQNGINISEIEKQKADIRELYGFSKYDKLLIMVASLRPQKDQDTIIKCLKFLPEHYKLLLVGDGVRREDLEKLSLNEKVSHRVKFLGVKTNVFSLIKMSDISILSSHYEGFGIAAAESMACGIPTIASDVLGLNGVVKNGGLLFERGNIEELKAKILSLEDREYYKNISNKGMVKAIEYDTSKMINNLLELYKMITK